MIIIPNLSPFSITHILATMLSSLLILAPISLHSSQQAMDQAENEKTILHQLYDYFTLESLDSAKFDIQEAIACIEQCKEKGVLCRRFQSGYTPLQQIIVNDNLVLGKVILTTCPDTLKNPGLLPTLSRMYYQLHQKSDPDSLQEWSSLLVESNVFHNHEEVELQQALFHLFRYAPSLDYSLAPAVYTFFSETDRIQKETIRSTLLLEGISMLPELANIVVDFLPPNSFLAHQCPGMKRALVHSLACQSAKSKQDELLSLLFMYGADISADGVWHSEEPARKPHEFRVSKSETNPISDAEQAVWDTAQYCHDNDLFYENKELLEKLEAQKQKIEQDLHVQFAATMESINN